MNEHNSRAGVGRRILKGAVAAYVLLSAALVGYLIIHTHAGYVVGTKLGLIDVPEITPIQKAVVLQHARLDRNLAPGAVVFLGDSHILGLNVTAITQKGVNFGVGSETTVGLLARLPRYKSISKARSVVIGIGYNDIDKRGATQIAQNVATILQRTSAPVVLSGLLPVSPGTLIPERDADRINQIIKKTNELLKAACTVKCRFLDPFPRFAVSIRNKRYHEGDGVHLNVHGYEIWQNLISNTLK